ncbi:hypothetical protein C5167_036868 [Papaver somniferum]|uniref:Uncharacterized protein n=1 Tax=Papaver somniferum TaxID=3469 RepID=A0A4Y7I953_PAPSO|nr:hypothetical protein C5167_036868 [Papaver somniferum]
MFANITRKYVKNPVRSFRVEKCDTNKLGIDAALSLFLSYLMEEVSLQGQVKLVVHAMRLCQLRLASESEDDIKGPTLLALLCMLESRKAFNNVFLRHHLFCILQLAVYKDQCNQTLFCPQKCATL